MKTMFGVGMSICVVGVTLLCLGCGTMPAQESAAAVVEIRPAFDEAGEGLTPAVGPFSGRPIYVSDEVLISNADFAWAASRRDDLGWAVNFKLTDEASARFADATERMVGKRLAILVDGKVVSAPTVRSRIIGSGQITGNFTEQEAQRIAEGLTADGR
jgi:preprotein translocase subunit SecD